MRVTSAHLRDVLFDPEDGTSVVMVAHRVIALSTLATEVLTDASARAMTVEGIAANLVQRFGSPPSGGEGALAIAQSLVEVLLQEGVLVTTDPEG